MTFIASGQYGCAFSPALPCDLPRPRKKHVGKVFAKDREAIHEQNIQEHIIYKVDPTHTFTVGFLGNCTITELSDKDDHARCPHLWDNSPIRYKQLIYNYGGVSLDDLLKRPKRSMSLKKILAAMLPIFKGVAKLNTMGYIHQDIKPANILVKDNKCYLIDFGICVSRNKIFTASNNHVLVHPYPFYPPEFKLEAAKGSFDTFTKLVNKNWEHTTYIPVKRTLTTAGVNFEGDLRATWDSQKRDYKKVDSYSLGVVLAMIAQHYKKKTQMLQELYAIIHNLTHQDCVVRLNSDDAATLYEQFVKHRC